MDLATETARALADLVRHDGSFRYRFDSETGVDKPGYNILRHAGCVWILHEAARSLVSLAEVGIAADRALSWMLRTNVTEIPGAGRCLAEGGAAKLGGSALAVLAILSSQEETPERLDCARTFCKYLIGQFTGDDFVHKRDVASGNELPFRSDYYTGEALFALLYAGIRQPHWHELEIAGPILAMFVARGYGIAEHSHWMMYAVEAAYDRIDGEPLLRYAASLIIGILDNPGYRHRACCTSIACRSEALLCFLRIAARSRSCDPALVRRARDALLANIQLQLRDRLENGLFPRGQRSSMVRIDYSQHNLAVLIGVLQL